MSERIGTTCVQGGWRPGDGEPRQVPIYQNTTWKYDTSEHMGRLFDLEESGYFYTRLANPTNDAVAAKVAELEGGTAAMLTVLGPGGELLRGVQHRRRGRSRGGQLGHLRGTYNLLAHTMGRMGLECTFVDPHCTDEELKAAFRPNTKCVFGETHRQPGALGARHRALRGGGPRATACRSSWTTPSPRRCCAVPSSGAPTS
ncbi:MAG: PLP-dependent transferase [Adlercreutzia equolifaciens]